LTLSSLSRIGLHFASSFHLNWKEVEVFSEKLYDFFDSKGFQLGKNTTTSNVPISVNISNTSAAINTTRAARSPALKRQKRGSDLEDVNAETARSSMAQYTHKCALLSTLSIAWSAFVNDEKTSKSISFLAFSGKKVSTIWTYDRPLFDSPSSELSTSTYLSSKPCAWIDTEKYGWVTTSCWPRFNHQPKQSCSTPKLMLLALGTTSGNVVLTSIPVAQTHHCAQLTPNRIIPAPYHQPVSNLLLDVGVSDGFELLVASGSMISVWNTKQPKVEPKKWKAHKGVISGLDINYFGDIIFSCSTDGTVKAWEKGSLNEIKMSKSQDKEYPVYGLCVSPNSVQVACMYVIPPAARPNRKSQADVSYTRVSSALEYLPSPYAQDEASFVTSMCGLLQVRQDLTTFGDIVRFCYEDNANLSALHGNNLDNSISAMLSKLQGLTSDTAKTSQMTRRPYYLSFCDELEKQYADATIKEASIYLLQAAYFLYTCIPPAESYVTLRDDTVQRLQRQLYTHWSIACLKELVTITTIHKKKWSSLVDNEKLSALLMADFLSVQEDKDTTLVGLVETIYMNLGSKEDKDRWSQIKQTISSIPNPTSRQKCFICNEAVPFSEFEIRCKVGHLQERCFVSFQCISSMDSWKCLGCGAMASETALVIPNSTSPSPPFYLLSQSSKMNEVVCRLCGNLCSFFRY
jgi:hypothetical protein